MTKRTNNDLRSTTQKTKDRTTPHRKLPIYDNREQTKIYEVPHRKLKIEQHPPYYKSTNIWQRGKTMIYEVPHRKLKI